MPNKTTYGRLCFPKLVTPVHPSHVFFLQSDVFHQDMGSMFLLLELGQNSVHHHLKKMVEVILHDF